MKMCLIGSTRFRALHEEANRELSKQGHIVYSVSCFGNSGDDLTEREKEILDLVHLRKLAESEIAVLITDKSYYIGDSTRRELLWCHVMGNKGPIVRMYDQETKRAAWDHSPELEKKFRGIFSETGI